MTTKVHLAVDGRGLPLSIVLTPGNVNDATAFGRVLDSIRIPRAITGRPRTTPARVLADNAYPAGRYATCCGAGASLPRSPNAETRRPTAGDAEPTAAVHPLSTKTFTATAMWSNDVSPVSSSSVRSRRGSASSPIANGPESSWQL
ncbi:transposase [Streptodolium elevatio]|uniref:transposase n=1 Tax=Streptodolium elevatio TaxID=3157996 RepID=UPI003F4CFDC2